MTDLERDVVEFLTGNDRSTRLPQVLELLPSIVKAFVVEEEKESLRWIAAVLTQQASFACITNDEINHFRKDDVFNALLQSIAKSKHTIVKGCIRSTLINILLKCHINEAKSDINKNAETFFKAAYKEEGDWEALLVGFTVLDRILKEKPRDVDHAMFKDYIVLVLGVLKKFAERKENTMFWCSVVKVLWRCLTLPAAQGLNSAQGAQLLYHLGVMFRQHRNDETQHHQLRCLVLFAKYHLVTNPAIEKAGVDFLFFFSSSERFAHLVGSGLIIATLLTEDSTAVGDLPSWPWLFEHLRGLMAQYHQKGGLDGFFAVASVFIAGIVLVPEEHLKMIVSPNHYINALHILLAEEKLAEFRSTIAGMDVLSLYAAARICTVHPDAAEQNMRKELREATENAVYDDNGHHQREWLLGYFGDGGAQATRPSEAAIQSGARQLLDKVLKRLRTMTNNALATRCEFSGLGSSDFKVTVNPTQGAKVLVNFLQTDSNTSNSALPAAISGSPMSTGDDTTGSTAAAGVSGGTPVRSGQGPPPPVNTPSMVQQDRNKDWTQVPLWKFSSSKDCLGWQFMDMNDSGEHHDHSPFTRPKRTLPGASYDEYANMSIGSTRQHGTGYGTKALVITRIKEACFGLRLTQGAHEGAPRFDVLPASPLGQMAVANRVVEYCLEEKVRPITANRFTQAVKDDLKNTFWMGEGYMGHTTAVMLVAKLFNDRVLHHVAEKYLEDPSKETIQSGGALGRVFLAQHLAYGGLEISAFVTQAQRRSLKILSNQLIAKYLRDSTKNANDGIVQFVIRETVHRGFDVDQHLVEKQVLRFFQEVAARHLSWNDSSYSWENATATFADQTSVLRFLDTKGDTFKNGVTKRMQFFNAEGKKCYIDYLNYKDACSVQSAMGDTGSQISLTNTRGVTCGQDAFAKVLNGLSLSLANTTALAASSATVANSNKKLVESNQSLVEINQSLVSALIGERGGGRQHQRQLNHGLRQADHAAAGQLQADNPP